MSTPAPTASPDGSSVAHTTSRSVFHRRVQVDGLSIFYREVGSPELPTLLLLHGFPTSSHLFRHLLVSLADRFHLVAPDLPGFGFSDAPARENFAYTFDHLAEVIVRFTDALALHRYALYVFDCRWGWLFHRCFCQVTGSAIDGDK